MNHFVDSSFPASPPSSFTARKCQATTRTATKTIRALRQKLQTKSPLRTPLPILTEEEDVLSTEIEQSRKWEETTCIGSSNVHIPQRKRSIGEATLRQLLAVGDILQEEMTTAPNNKTSAECDCVIATGMER
eukprot:scaffold574_cov190-Amphora_coffeaeformis.AAC.1